MTISTIIDFQTHGLPPHTVWDGQWDSVVRLLDAAESKILTALRTAGYDEPIPESSWTPEMKQNACIIAGYQLLRVRGWTATDGGDAEFVEEYKRVLEWLERVRENKEKPLPKNAAGETLDATPASDPEGIATYSESLRGW